MVVLGNNVVLWAMFLLIICSFTSLGDGAMQQHIKSFELDGNVFDCIDIYKQSSLRHPLLVNHTLQLKPNHPSKKNDHIMGLSSHVWNLSKRCPEGSVPIQRTQRNSHFRGDLSYLSRWHKSPPNFLRGRQDVGRDGFMHEHAVVRNIGSFYGGKASLNVWNPQVTQGDSSISQIWILSKDGATSLEAGWIVYPDLYRDRQTRFFTYWTSDGHNNGCFDTQCRGFVQTTQHGILGALLQPVSVYGGLQRTIDVEIFKDKKTGNWWLNLQGVGVGYWPKELVPSLAGGASIVDFGGEVVYLRSGAHTDTQMGSGHFPSEGFKKSSFFRNVQLLQTTYQYQSPGNGGIMIVESSPCYDLQLGGNLNGPWGYYFFYGGPGRSDKCP